MRDNDFSFELCLDCGVEWFRNEKKILPGQNKDKKLAPKEVMDSMVLQRVIPLASYSDTVQKYVHFHIEGWAKRGEGLLLTSIKQISGVSQQRARAHADRQDSNNLQAWDRSC